MRSFLFSTSVVLVFACGEVLPTTGEDADAGTVVVVGSDAGDAGSDVRTNVLSDAPVEYCGARPGPVMVRVGPTSGRFCVDSTEVTAEQYASFMASAAPSWTSECAWKTSRRPGSGSGALPVTDVDWCDAQAFCLWAGKKLCSEKRWLSACTGDTTRDYPYGDTYDAKACSTPVEPLHAAGSMVTCEGGYRGLFDLVGNVHEWTDDCSLSSTRDTDNCPLKGETKCSSAGTTQRGAYYYAIGFRCCADD